MTRTDSRTVITAASAGQIRPADVARLGLASGDIWLTTADHDLHHDFGDGSGRVLVRAVGDLAGVSPVSETGEPQAQRARLTLSGLKPAFMSAALSEAYQGRPCQVWRVFVDDSYAVVAHMPKFQGAIAAISGSVGEQASITVTAVNWLERWHRPIGGKMSDADQKARAPGDAFFSRAAGLDDRVILFGRKG